MLILKGEANRAEHRASVRQSMMCRNRLTTSRLRIWRLSRNTQGGVMFSLWNDLLWEQPPPAGVGASSPGDHLFPQGLPVPTLLLLYRSSLLKEFYLFSVCCWKAKRFSMFNYPSFFISSGAQMFHSEAFQREDVVEVAACYTGSPFWFPFTQQPIAALAEQAEHSSLDWEWHLEKYL